MKPPSLVEQLRGATKLAVEATRNVTDVVEAMHGAIGPLLKPFAAPTYAIVRGVAGLVGTGLDAALAQLGAAIDNAGADDGPVLSEASRARKEYGPVLAALNGVLGDYLAATNNPLATRFELRVPVRSGRRLLVMVHGSSMNEEQWLRAGHDHGVALAQGLGLTRVLVRYNSGLHVSDNGALLAQALDALVAEWPEPVESLTFVAHSMGGLVARSAFAAGGAWRKLPAVLVTLGTPHHGAPLERAGAWAHALLTATKYSAPLARLAELRSAGVTDLRYGNLLSSDWADADRFALGADARTPVPLPAGVRTLAVAGTLNGGGDGLVPVASALGQHDDAARALRFDATLVTEATHLDLLNSPAVHAWLLEQLS